METQYAHLINIKLTSKISIMDKNILMGSDSPLFGSEIIFLFSRTNTYAVRRSTGDVISVNAAKYANLLRIDNYIYSITNETSAKQPGVFIESITGLFRPQDLTIDFNKSFKLKTAMGGQSTLL